MLSAPPFEKSSKPRDGFDTAAFIDSVVADLGSAVRGYAVFLRGKAATIIAKATYGYARTPSEERGVQPFNGRTQTAWGSVTKMITTAAVIDKTERSNTRSLDEKMIDFLPERWRKHVHKGHRDVTIRHLLSYQSGLGMNAPPGVDNKDILQRLSNPPEKKVGKRKYSNVTFGIFHYMGRFFRQARWDELEAGFTPGEIDYDSYVFGHGLAIYKQVTRNRIFKPLGIEASCNEVDYAGDNYALFYDNAQSERGYFLNPQDRPGCATGGIVMSARHMGKFLHALTRTDEVISRDNYKALLAIPNNDVLGWNGNRPVKDGKAFHKAGGRTLRGKFIPGNTASGHAGADIMAFPNGMSAVVAINSARAAGTKKLRDILVDAYDAGLS